MKRTALFLVGVLALAAGAALAQDGKAGSDDASGSLREQVARLRERVKQLEARVKELESFFEDDAPDPDAAQATLTDLSGPDALKKAFTESAGKPRLVLFMSPT